MVRQQSLDRRPATRGQPLTGLTPCTASVHTDVQALLLFPYHPVSCSAGGYDLKPTAESTGEDMSHKGVFLVSLGMRYKGYCANLGRTFIVDPDKVSAQIPSVLLCRQLSPRSKSPSTTCC